MRYLTFKNTAKYDFKYDSSKQLISKKLEKKEVDFSKNENHFLKIKLNKIGKKDCDILKIMPFSENETVDKLTFSFKYFNFTEKKYYKISIYKEKEPNFLKRLFDTNKSFWKIIVYEINEKDDSVKNTCLELSKNTQESLDIEKLLRDKRKLKQKILDLINFHKYNVCEKGIQMTIF